MSNLRNKVIRLAHQKPELRPHLLPLIKEASEGRVKSAIRSILKSLDLSKVEAQNASLWNSNEGTEEFILILKDYVDAVRFSPQWRKFIENYSKKEFKKLYKLLSNAYTRDNIEPFEKTFPRSKFFKNARPKQSKYALSILKTMKKILQKKTFWEEGIISDDFLDHWQGDLEGRVAIAQSFGFRDDVRNLNPDVNSEDLIYQETKAYLDSLE